MPVKKITILNSRTIPTSSLRACDYRWPITIISITILARRLNPFENARESMELHTKPFEIELIERNQRNKIQRQDSIY
ncbi:uncharacterized protein K444DRAFT_315122 [Hyaloscypha bicolor E]|uniref:Uncharacterized protein n=1 Tax=Hyaloscypha bicolor E TaxID=1095630 RepID=A0A2J6TM71_9HELO|nr:uncharacterized protein K444DRAFT_315122 [Hyaloscypha bicolor E]PMD64114.1 hypothetical protein K444DRAFT_315122 [Hyaloscypha bicolor E]